MEPTILKTPRIYNGAGIYNTGAGGGGGGGGVPDNIKLYNAVRFDDGWLCNDLDGKYSYKTNYRYVYSGQVKINSGNSWLPVFKVYSPGYARAGASINCYPYTGNGNIVFSLSNFTNSTTEAINVVFGENLGYYPVLIEFNGESCNFNTKQINFTGGLQDIGASYIDFGGNPTITPIMEYVKIYNENGIKLHEFLPAKNTDTNNEGVFDKVTGEFWANARTQTLIIED